MAVFSKVNIFTRDLAAGVHKFGTDTFKVMLTNTAPTAANAVKADLTEITAGSGYTAGGTTTGTTLTTAAGVAKAVAVDVTFTAAGGSIGPFRYAALYNDTPTSPADPLIGWIDYGSAVTLADGESLLVDFDGAAGALTFT